MVNKYRSSSKHITSEYTSCVLQLRPCIYRTEIIGADINSTTLFNIIAEPLNRATTRLSPENLKLIENAFYRSGKSSIAQLNEVYITVFTGIPFPMFSPLFETFNAKIGEMNSNGIIDQWNKWSINIGLIPNRYNEEPGPQVLTLEHLAVGFEACLTFMALSLIAFILELIFDCIMCRIYRMRGKQIEEHFAI